MAWEQEDTRWCDGVPRAIRLPGRVTAWRNLGGGVRGLSVDCGKGGTDAAASTTPCFQPAREDWDVGGDPETDRQITTRMLGMKSVRVRMLPGLEVTLLR